MAQSGDDQSKALLVLFREEVLGRLEGDWSNWPAAAGGANPEEAEDWEAEAEEDVWEEEKVRELALHLTQLDLKASRGGS